jgi:hypothetical protein
MGPAKGAAGSERFKIEMCSIAVERG